MLDMRTCPTCGSTRLKRVRRGVRRTVGGEKYIVPAVEFHECPDCGEKLYSRQAMQKVESFRPKSKVAA